MYRRTIKIRTLFFLFSIITSGIEFASLYILENFVITFVLAVISTLLFSHLLLETAISHIVVFYYSLCTFLISGSLSLFFLIYGSPVILTNYVYCLILLIMNLGIPIIYCTFRNLYDRGPRYEAYRAFFINMSIIIVLCLILTGIYKFFIHPWSLSTDDASVINFIPFFTIASNIEEYLYKSTNLKALLAYIIKNICFFIPIGFYIQLLLKRTHYLLKLLLFAAIPLVIEILQLITGRGHCDIDDIILGILGAMLGVLFYNIINWVYRSKKDLEFLEERTNLNWLDRYYRL